MNLNRENPTHIALIELAFAAAQLVEDLHDYQHFLGGHDDWPFSLRDIEKHYEQVTLAWERFRTATSEKDLLEPPKSSEVRHARPAEPRGSSTSAEQP